MDDRVASQALESPHGFLSGPQSNCGELDRIAGDTPTVWVEQVHSARAIHVTEPLPEGSLPRADAMVTATPKLRLAIVTADCAPVLLEDKRAGVVAAAHAGWRGAHDGVLENTLAAMVEIGAEQEMITAAIGPCIAQASYEVDEGFRLRFAPEDERFFAPGQPGHFQFDLPGYIASRLKQAGIGEIDALGIDTYTNARDFHSYRRSTHQGTPTEGRQISFIELETD